MKHLIFALIVFSLCYPAFCAVETADIAAARSRSTTNVSAADLEVISKFWRTSLDRMFLAPETQEVVEVRRQLSEQKGTEGPFRTAYIEEAIKDISVAFETVEKVELADKKAIVHANLMILVAEFQEPKLIPLALKRVADTDDVVRYWAVKSLTQPTMITELTKPNSADKQTVLKALLDRAAVEQLPQIMRMIIVFAGSVDDPAARQILTSVADARIEAYKNWTVINEDMDIYVLNALGGVAVLQQGETRSTFGRKFAELYSLVLQRYMKGQSTLSAQNMERLVTVIAEVDQNCLNKMFEIKTGIITAIGRKTGLEREYETLFGNRMMAGQLAAKFKFDYGKDASGKAMTAPPELGAAPQTLAGK